MKVRIQRKKFTVLVKKELLIGTLEEYDGKLDKFEDFLDEIAVEYTLDKSNGMIANVTREQYSKIINWRWNNSC